MLCTCYRGELPQLNKKIYGGAKMAEEQDGEITFSLKNSWKEQLKGKQSVQNNF